MARIHASTATIQVQDQNGAPLDGADVLLNGKNLGKTLQGKVTARFLGRGEYRFAAGKPAYKSGSEKTLALIRGYGGDRDLDPVPCGRRPLWNRERLRPGRVHGVHHLQDPSRRAGDGRIRRGHLEGHCRCLRSILHPRPGGGREIRPLPVPSGLLRG